jgi:hypothetical protein
MHLPPTPFTGNTTSSRRAVIALCAAANLVTITLQAQFIDDFNDGNDTANPAWTHLTGYVGSSGQTFSFPGGNTYRLQAPNNGTSSLGFVGSYVGVSYSDVTVSADFVTFGGPGANATFSVAARLNGNNTLGGLAGYAFAYEPFAAGGLGEIVLYRINPGVSITDIGSLQVSLDPSKDYKFVLDISGTSLHGQVFEIGGGLVGERFATDATYASGFPGVLGYAQSPVAPTDFTLDNFTVTVPEPAVGSLLGLGAFALIACRRRRHARV